MGSEHEKSPGQADPADETLPVDAFLQLDRVAADFEKALKKGEKPVIEEFAAEFEGEQRKKVVLELLRLEMEHRLRDTGSDLGSEYLARFDNSVVEQAVHACFGDRAGRAQPPAAEERPETVGPYKILDRLGEGGMGTVYLAEQKEPIARRVALKLIKLGMDTKEVVARFEAERQALAMMDHPNIARVHDAGTTPDGRPYFIMEYVRGVPLDAYCDRHRLSLEERLELFCQVCQGVEHANRRGVVHRDLKPSNVLVSTPDDKPVAKIIDFGVARATNQRLTEKSIYTELGRVIGTPAYMSPEQADLTSEEVDHRADVYSLGVMLYELLVGELPLEPEALQKAAFDEIIRRIREDDPPTPSTRWTRLNADRMGDLAKRRRTSPGEVSHALRGDLDWITMKALDKDRGRRYSSAGNLAEDVARFLAGDPVDAGPPGITYKIKKYVRKNRVPATAALVVFLTLLVGGGAVVAVQSLANAKLEEQNTTISKQAAELQQTNTTITRQAGELEAANVSLKAERDQVLRLADVKRLEDRLAEADDLWPCVPGKVEAMRTWLGKAKILLDNRPIHEATLARLRNDEALPYDDEQQAEDRRTHPEAAQLADARDARQELLQEAEKIEKAHVDGKGTLITYADDLEERPITVSFRRSFEVEDPSKIEKLTLSATIDDGCVVYLNGIEVHRDNMPEGDVSAMMPSESCKKEDPPDRSVVELVGSKLETLREGGNQIAVEVHNCSRTCADLVFDLALTSSSEVVRAGSEWRYHDGTGELSAAWKEPDFDDASWKTGPAPLGYGFSGGPGRALELRRAIARIDADIENLEAEVTTRRTWKFADDETDWQHRTLAGLIAGLETLPKTVADVEKRLEFAERVEKRSIDDHRAAWDEAIRSVADESECPHYKGLRLKEQLGLVPIGRDPDSGLWEFAHIQSGKIPARDPKTGKLVLTGDMSIVLVLIPGGTFRMGAERPSEERPPGSPNVDPGAHVNEGPVHEVALEPFFLSKFEMTQGQWERFTGANPSYHKGGTIGGVAQGPLNPVEQVDWAMCAETLRRLDLVLPTEAQWEYATRAGTSSVWWTGSERDSLLGKVNLADQAAKRAGARWSGIKEWPELDDGHVVHAPVGSFPANPWGLHEVHDNVWEWCRDWYGSYSLDVREGDGRRKVSSSSASNRVFRGGSYGNAARLVRSAYRGNSAPSIRLNNLGLRPARVTTK